MIAFFLALPHTEQSTLWQFLLDYTTPQQKLILAKETSKKSHLDISGQHFHVLAEWDKHKYEAFKKTIIDKHYSLVGRSTTGNARKYGQVRAIKDIDKMLSYTIKCNDYSYQNYTQEELEKAYAQSYEKEDRTTITELCIEHIKKTIFLPDLQNKPTLAINIIEEMLLIYWIENIDKVISKTTLQHIIVRYLTQEYPYYKNHINCILQYIKKNT